jgi:hypothetical protein
MDVGLTVEVGVTSDEFRTMATTLPGVEEGSSYGMRAWRCRGKALAGLWNDGETLGITVSFDERDMLIAAAPETFFVTDHYRNYPRVLIRLRSVEQGTLERLLVQAWRDVASKKLIAAYDAERPSRT